MSSNTIQRTTLQLYRDCLRLVRHVAPGTTSAKSMALRRTVRNEFRKHAAETDKDKVTALKANAVRALSNYLLAVSAPKDAQLSQSAKDFHGRSVNQAQQQQEQRERQVDSNSSTARNGTTGSNTQTDP